VSGEPVTPDRPPDAAEARLPATPARHRRAANALWAWRTSARTLDDDPNQAPQRARYEQAVRAVLPALARHASAPALLSAYFDEGRGWRLAAARACRSVPGGRQLSPTLVGEVAFWRRLRVLIDALPASAADA
jgi:hypothetical protein